MVFSLKNMINLKIKVVSEYEIEQKLGTFFTSNIFKVATTFKSKVKSPDLTILHNHKFELKKLVSRKTKKKLV
jgi:hypothetical protein